MLILINKIDLNTGTQTLIIVSGPEKRLPVLMAFLFCSACNLYLYKILSSVIRLPGIRLL
jgi:hypothetical protein